MTGIVQNNWLSNGLVIYSRGMTDSNSAEVVCPLVPLGFICSHPEDRSLKKSLDNIFHQSFPEYELNVS